MAIDTSIYNSLMRPPKSVAEYDAEAQASQGNALATQLRRQQLAEGKMKQDEYTRGLRDQETQRNAVAGFGADQTANYNALLRTGNLKSAQDYQKSIQDQQKAGADVAHTKAQTAKERAAVVDASLKRYRTALDFVDTPEAAARWLQAQYENPEVGEYMASTLGPLDQAVSRLPQDPQQFAQWRSQAALGMEKHMQEARLVAAQAETGRHNKASEGIQVRGQDRQSADNAAQRQVTMRGQNMTDSRARETNAATLTKPFEVTGPDGSPTLVRQDRQGNIIPVEGYTPKGAPDKPLPPAVVKTVTEARDNASTMDRLNTTFKPEFAGKGILGMGADMQLGISGNMGVDKDAVEWWKNYRKQAELVERHALFGAALTPGEQASWQSADISPGMNKDVIARNLKTRSELSKKVAETAKQDMIDAGHSGKRVSAIADRGAASGAGNLSAAEQSELEQLRARFGKK